VGNLPHEEQLAGVGGTFAPTNEIATKGNTTRLLNTFYGEVSYLTVTNP
jgi:hypothetical protein